MKKLSYLLLALISCSSPHQGSLDVGKEVKDIQDIKFLDIKEVEKEEIQPKKWVRPEGSAAIRFFVDDSANQTYKDGEIRWTGSFSWDEATNTIKYAVSWLPSDGPYPPLYDDGPMSEGGHEPEGAKAGDHIFECEVWFIAEEDTIFYYGALDKYDGWIWIGPNGQFTVPAHSTDTIKVQGLVIPPFGEYDLKVTIDLKELNKEFSGITSADYDIYYKSSANSWHTVQLVDDGQKGDEKAGDDVFTYVHSEHLSEHVGLIAEGQHVQFVFMFVVKGEDPKLGGAEYKVGIPVQCALEGVKAYSDYKTKGSFHEEKIILERSARALEFNTTVIFGEGKPWCKEDKDCFGPEGTVKCESDGCTGEVTPSNPVIQFIDPKQGPVSGDTEVTITGSGFMDGAQVAFGGVSAKTVTFVTSSEVKAVTPPHPAGEVNVVLKNPDGQEAVCPACFEYKEGQQINLPDWGRLDGPLSVETFQDMESEEIFAEVYEGGLTENGGGEGLVIAEIGYGPFGSDPSTSSQWQWLPAQYSHALGNNAVFVAQLKSSKAGKYAFTFRASVDGGQNYLYLDSDGVGGDFGFDITKLGTWDNQEIITGQVFIASINPPSSPTFGGEVVEVIGFGFKPDAKLYLGDEEIKTQETSESKIVFKTPKHQIGIFSVKVVNPDGNSYTKKDGFAFVPKGTPKIDGFVGEDWDETFLVADNKIPTDWGENNLTSLRVAYDDIYLYIGIIGKTEQANAIIGYIDTDFGKSTGISDMNLITDNTGVLDNVISSNVKVSVNGFGADVAVGTKGMASFIEGEELWPKGDLAGFRDLSNTQDLAWWQGTVMTSENAIECAIRLDTLFKGFIPKNANLAIFIRLLNQDGQYTSNQALPSSVTTGDCSAEDCWNQSAVAIIPVR